MEGVFLFDENSIKKINYSISMFDPHKYYLLKHIDEISSLIFENQSSYQNIVDIGSGTSPYKSLFIKNVQNYLSVDIDINRYSHLDLIASAHNLPLKNSSTNIILFIEVLEHIYYYQKTIGELNRVLINGGYLIITVPLLIGKHDTYDFFRYTDETLKCLLTTNGFKIELMKERGGIFACLASIIYNIPGTLFRKNKKASSIFLMLLAPIVLISLYLDKLDKYKEFTLGYDILAKKIK